MQVGVYRLPSLFNIDGQPSAVIWNFSAWKASNLHEKQDNLHFYVSNLRQYKVVPAGELLVSWPRLIAAGRARTGEGGGCVVVACLTLLAPKGEKLA